MRKYIGGRGRRAYNFMRERRRGQLTEFWSEGQQRERQRGVMQEVWDRPDSPLRNEQTTERKRKQMVGNSYGSNPSPETSAKLAAASNRRWDKPGAREAQAERNAARWSQPGAREEHAAKIRGVWSDPNATYNTEEYRKSVGREQK